jgi:hypothetical protein
MLKPVLDITADAMFTLLIGASAAAALRRGRDAFFHVLFIFLAVIA